MEYNNDYWEGPRKFWEGQQQINRELCRVDWKLIKALELINATFVAMKPPVNKDVLEKLEEVIAAAYAINRAVAEIKPPGCAPPLVAEPPEETYTATPGPTG